MTPYRRSTAFWLRWRCKVRTDIAYYILSAAHSIAGCIQIWHYPCRYHHARCRRLYCWSSYSWTFPNLLDLCVGFLHSNSRNRVLVELAAYFHIKTYVHKRFCQCFERLKTCFSKNIVDANHWIPRLPINRRHQSQDWPFGAHNDGVIEILHSVLDKFGNMKMKTINRNLPKIDPKFITFILKRNKMMDTFLQFAGP